MRISPDGKYVGFVGGVGPQGAHHVLIFLNLSTGKTSYVEAPLIKATPFETESEVADFVWLNSNRVVLICEHPDGGTDGLAAVDRDGTHWWTFPELTNVIGRSGESDSFTTQIGSTAYEIDTEPNRLRKFDESRVTANGRDYIPLTDTSEAVSGWIAGQDGKVRVGYLIDNGWDTRAFYRRDENSPWIRLHDFACHGIGPVPMVVDWDDRTAYAPILTVHGTWGVGTYDLATQKRGPVIASDPVYDILSPTDTFNGRGYLVYSRKKEKLIGIVYPTQYWRTAWFDSNMIRVQEDVDRALPDGHNAVIGLSADDNVGLIESWSDRHPAIFYLLDLPTHRLRKIMNSAPWIDASLMARTFPLSFRTRDGLLAHGYVALPHGLPQKGLPLIVLSRSGFSFTRATFGYDGLVQFIASRGYAVLEVNPRGSPGYGKTFLDAGRGQMGTGVQADIADGVAWAKKAGIADPRRIAFLGYGIGGYSALDAVVREPDTYRCAVSVSGVSNWESLLRHLEIDNLDTRFLRLEVGDALSEGNRLRDISPINHVDRIKVPVLVAYRESDDEYMRDQSKDFAAALKDRGAACKVTVLRSTKSGADQFNQTVEFFTELESFLAANMK